ncbi:helix-turn-helix domain-containing protein [Natronomonas salsuginis]|uniref:Helix-turn-helix domain-containing protein n=1 Tax=Natronomonas salsuginis TaxID=2217661 RepID=A0A4U5JCY9_9EURY|nr:helix-turn-helix domain-containing protein [Natronomonas salsuginis]TKR25467.1 helix-turn-helix domain-containing protein [Natronomonas salsuginis]
MWRDVQLAAGTEEFSSTLEAAINACGLTVKEFAKRHDLSESTLYKITSGDRTNVRVETLQSITAALREEEGYGGRTIGLITTRGACDRAPSSIEAGGETYTIKPLPAQTIEDEIIKGVQADRDGIDGIVCGPIAAVTLEQVVDVPVGGLQFTQDLIRESMTDFAGRLD